MTQTMMAELADPESIDDQMRELFERFGQPETEDALAATLVCQAPLIRLIGSACEKTEVYRMASEKISKFRGELEESTPAQDRLVATWNCFLTALVDAPTSKHIAAAVRLYLPMVAAYLPNGGTALQAV